MDSKVEELHSRAKSLFAEFQQTGGSCIDEAVTLDREALQFCPPGHSKRAAALALLSTHLHGRYEQLGVIADLDEAISLTREALELCSQEPPDRFVSLDNLAAHLTTRYSQLGAIQDLEEAISLSREALSLQPGGHPDRFVSLNNLATGLSDRYDQLGAVQDLEEVVALSREALELQPQEHPGRSTSLNNLATGLSARYDQCGDIQDLEEMIVLCREALSLQPVGHPDRPISLNNLAAGLSTRYGQFGAIQDLEETVVLSREALGLLPRGHPGRSTSLNHLATGLSTRYDRYGDSQDLGEMIVLSREALSLQPVGHPDRSISLNNLATGLSTRYDQLGAIQDLEEVVVLSREALELQPPGHPNRTMSLNNLATGLSTRYDRCGDIQDLEEMIVLCREALSLQPVGHPDRSMSLNNLATGLSSRYGLYGVVQDLEGVIVLCQEALSLRPRGHPDRSTSLNNLAIGLSTRYDRYGVIQDLEEMIVLCEEALSLQPEGHPDRSTSLTNLASALFTRYEQLKVVQDLEEAIVLGRGALNLQPEGHPTRSVSLNNLAIHLSIRYDQLGELRDLEEAIALSREALHLRPQGHPGRSISLDNLAACLSTRHNQLKIVEDLEEAIVLGREALDLRPQGHPRRSQSLGNLAGYLCSRFRQSEHLQDKEELFSLYTQLVLDGQFVLSTDVFAARAWARAAEEFGHPSLLLAYETALRLLVSHLDALPSLLRQYIVVRKLTSSLPVDAFSACLRDHDPVLAVELLEQGRGVFWKLLSCFSSPLQDLIELGPIGERLADQFTQLVLHTSNALSAPGSDQHERLWRLNQNMQQVVTEIRNLPGFSRFLLPLPFSDLQHAAVGGPVIILNASQYSCDALVIFPDRDPVHIPLRIMQGGVRDLSDKLHELTVRAKRQEGIATQIAYLLRQVWDRIVSPVVNILQTTLPFQSRIWWCPTAEFSLLPLHAAGPYREGQRNLTDLYISSYTPTLTALLLARGGPLNFEPQHKCFIAIGQAKAPGEIELDSVNTELENIKQLIGGCVTFTQINGKESCISRVVEELGRNEWVHLACHGLPDRTRPLESAFALSDGHFGIKQIVGCKSWKPEFAYLSACHTTVGDKEEPDGVIHLASAMQFMGFRSVIGTMWAVDDDQANKIASTFYKHMVDGSCQLDHTRAAHALHRTMEIERGVPFDQRILYIHLGA